MVEVGAIQFTQPDFIVEAGSTATWRLEEVELLEFTGVYTYSSKEIWEGDIIEFQLLESGKRYTSEVVFVEGGFMADMATPLSRAMFVEVIGNIYEHPELLEAKP